VVSSGKDVGVFKGMGYPEDIADYFRIEDYSGYMWAAHNRFPTNTPGWWGGAPLHDPRQNGRPQR